MQHDACPRTFSFFRAGVVLKGVFISGTDTSVGKTLIARAIADDWRRRGMNFGVMKPIETGCENYNDWPADARALLNASGTEAALDEVCPVRFLEPLSPYAAARANGISVNVGRILEAYRQNSNRDWMLVEGAGGLAVPITARYTMADLAKALNLPVLIVARAGLGTINHTYLTTEYARQKGLRVVGIVVNNFDLIFGDASQKSNLVLLEELCGAPLIGYMPKLESTNIGPVSVAFDQYELGNRLLDTLSEISNN